MGVRHGTKFFRGLQGPEMNAVAKKRLLTHPTGCMWIMGPIHALSLPPSSRDTDPSEKGDCKEIERRGKQPKGGVERGSNTGLNYFGGFRAPRSPLSRKRGVSHDSLALCGFVPSPAASLYPHCRERQTQEKRETAKTTEKNRG